MTKQNYDSNSAARDCESFNPLDGSFQTMAPPSSVRAWHNEIQEHADLSGFLGDLTIVKGHEKVYKEYSSTLKNVLDVSKRR